MHSHLKGTVQCIKLHIKDGIFPVELEKVDKLTLPSLSPLYCCTLFVIQGLFKHQDWLL